MNVNKKWTKEQALLQLDNYISKIPALKKQYRFSSEHTRWVADVLEFLEEVFGRQSVYYLNIKALRWYETGTFIVGGPADPEGSWDPETAVKKRHKEAYVRNLESAKGFLLAASDKLKRSSINEVYEGKDTPPESSSIVRVINIAEHQLRKVIRKQPISEIDVQDAFENLLIGAGIEYSREAESIEYSSKTYRPDFTVPKIDLAIDIKLNGRKEREKKIIAEINDDILAYKTKYGNIFFVIYDLGFIRDVKKFSRNFEENQNVIVRVVKN